MRRLAPALLLIAASAWGQKGEVGVAAGVGMYRNGSITGPAGAVDAGVRNRLAIGAVVCEDLYTRLGGEVRWTYQDGDPFVSGAGARTNIRGQSHAFNYDMLFYVRPSGEKLRPYFAVGGGIKWYRISGSVPSPQPLSAIATLTGNDSITLLGSFGAGVKYYLGKQIALRFDFRDFVTPFPKGMIKAAAGGSPRGVLHQLTPMIGVSYVIR